MVFVRWCRLWIAALVLTGLLGACEQPSTSDVSQTEAGTFQLGSVAAVDTVARAVAPSGRPLVLDGFRGSVDLQGTAQSTADLQFVKRGRAKDTETARGVLADVAVTESGTQEAYTYTLETNGGGTATVDLTGTVPTATVLRVKKSSGPVSIAGVDGPMTVTHEHGPVIIQGATDSVEVEIRNGDVTVHLAALPTDAAVSLRTANGDVTLRVPPDASAKLTAETEAGDVRSQGLSLTEQYFSPRGAGGQYSAQLEPGEATVDLQTKNGTILIAAADAMPTDTAATDTATAPSAGPLQKTPEASAPPVPAADTTVRPTAESDSVMPDTGTAGSMTSDTVSSDTSQR
ncbi:MAG: hypothetical protein BRD55_10900 [Bacteroidetes bacterium SW_9_63_38]|nr:MAG: hypothetical protein BRD55_10900 [Bacteroidetes bacterium SW_9_63_38]